jgi:hypothetical protein
MTLRERRLEEIRKIIYDPASQLPEGCAERLSVQFANMMAEDAWEDNDELPSLVALTTFLSWLRHVKHVSHPGIGSNGRGSITAFWREGDIRYTYDFLSSGKVVSFFRRKP